MRVYLIRLKDIPSVGASCERSLSTHAMLRSFFTIQLQHAQHGFALASPIVDLL